MRYDRRRLVQLHDMQRAVGFLLTHAFWFGILVSTFFVIPKVRDDFYGMNGPDAQAFARVTVYAFKIMFGFILAPFACFVAAFILLDQYGRMVADGIQAVFAMAVSLPGLVLGAILHSTRLVGKQVFFYGPTRRFTSDCYVWPRFT